MVRPVWSRLPCYLAVLLATGVAGSAAAERPLSRTLSGQAPSQPSPAPAAAKTHTSDEDDEADDEESADEGEKAGASAVEAGPGAGGHYSGVAPGSQNLPPRAPRLPLKSGPQRLTWPGFQVRDGVPTVFLELTGAPEYQVDATRGAVMVTLKNTVVPLRNNRRPLRVGEFGTAVKQIDTQPQKHRRGGGREVRVVIRTTDASPPLHREHVEPAAGGFQLLVLELPPKS